jgi:LPXTG-motif cell wall-anchored protein
MRNSVPKSLLLANLGLICFATGAFATHSSLTGPANLSGVYTSPQTVTVEGVGSGIKVFCDDFIDGHIAKTLGGMVLPSPVAMAEPSAPLLLGVDLLMMGSLVLVVRRRKSKIRCI